MTRYKPIHKSHLIDIQFPSIVLAPGAPKHTQNRNLSGPRKRRKLLSAQHFCPGSRNPPSPPPSGSGIRVPKTKEESYGNDERCKTKVMLSKSWWSRWASI